MRYALRFGFSLLVALQANAANEDAGTLWTSGEGESACHFSSETVQRYKPAIQRALQSAETLHELKSQNRFVSPTDEYRAIELESELVFQTATGDELSALEKCVAEAGSRDSGCMPEINRALIIGVEFLDVFRRQLHCEETGAELRVGLNQIEASLSRRIDDFTSSAVQRVIEKRTFGQTTPLDLVPICLAYSLRITDLSSGSKSNPANEEVVRKLRDQRRMICD